MKSELLFSAIFILRKENHPLETVKTDVFLTLTYHLILSNFGHCLTLKIFYYQIMAILPLNATETVRFLKTFKNFGFLFVVRVKTWIFQNRWRWQNSCGMRIKWYHFLKMSFPPSLWGYFGEKSENFQSSKNWTTRWRTKVNGKKTLSSIEKVSLPKWENGKPAGSSRPSCCQHPVKEPQTNH